MTRTSIVSDAVRADAAWVRDFADEIAELRWPTVHLAGSAVAATAQRAVPGLDELVTELHAWAGTVLAAADALAAADVRAAGGL